MTARPRVSVILSFRNEEEVIPELIARLQAALGPLPLDYELIFVNDDSTDGSRALLEARAKEDAHVKLINMSRRFGVAECVLAGMKHARGDAVIMMDTDLQDPPELLPEMIAKWQEGADVVYTVRTARAGEPAYKLWLTKWAYRTINAVANTNLPEEAGDFKLLSRRVAAELLKLDEKDPYLRGLVTWLGFKQVPVYYQRQARAKGETHFPIFGSKGPLITFVFGVTSFSLLPMAAFIAIGGIVCALALLLLLAVVLRAVFGGAAGEMWFLGGLLLFVSGVQLIGLGVLGVYLGRVYNDVRNRPRYIVESTVGLGD
jgi:polyisoprenyl-phosphate glycosyltransferase